MNDKPKKLPAETTEKKWEPLTSLRAEIDHLFDDFEGGWPFAGFGRGLRAGSAFGLPSLRDIQAPVIDVADREKEVQIKAELPGMDEKDVEVSLSGNILTISGEKKEEREEGEKGSDYHLSERRYGSFKRSLSIPEGIDGDKVKASFDKGVLTVTLPKKPEAQRKTKKIKVKAGKK